MHYFSLSNIPCSHSINVTFFFLPLGRKILLLAFQTLLIALGKQFSAVLRREVIWRETESYRLRNNVHREEFMISSLQNLPKRLTLVGILMISRQRAFKPLISNNKNQ